MASIAVLAIVLGCAAAQYFKGSLVTAATTAIAAVSAAFAAMGFYEWLAGILGRYTGGMAAWGDAIAFVVLFILVFAVLQTAIAQLLHEPIDLGHWPEQIGRPVCGAILGWVVAGVILMAAALAPLPLGYPYARFEGRRPDPDKPSRVLLNADGLITGWFGLVSRGSLQAMQGHESFATVHTGFLDQLYLNRLGIGNRVALRMETGTEAIEVRRPAVWDAPEGITDTEGRSLPAKPGQTLMLARIGFKSMALRDASPFTLSQLRLVCRPRDLAKRPLAGKGQAVYPAGFMQQARQLAIKGLDEQITLEAQDFGKDESVRWIDFGFYVPSGWVPVLAQFKLNNMVEVPSPVAADKAPQVIPFERRPAPAPPTMHADANQPAEANTPKVPNAPNAPAADGRGLSGVSQGVIGGVVTEGN